MDEAEEILLSSLRRSGVSLPSDLSLSSIKDLSPDALVSTCVQSLCLVGGAFSASLPTSLPDSASDRFKVCADVAAAIKSIGYKGELSFQQFLYPTKEESYKLLRFMVERLSESFQNRDVSDDISTKSASDSTFTSGDGTGVPGPLRESADAGSLCAHVECNKVGCYCKEEGVEDVSKEPRKPEELRADEEDTAREDSEYVDELEQTLASLQLEKSKVRHEIENLKDQENSLKEATQSKILDVQNLEAEYELLKAAVKMAFDDQHSVEFHLEELNEQAEARRGNLVKLEMLRNAARTVEGRQIMLDQSMHEQKPELQERLSKLKEIEEETEATLSEIHRREVEHAELLVELENLPKIPSRKYYIDRVTEMTKNSWKQDTDIHRILKEIREIQLESNSIQERLHRTYAVIEETVYRDTKNDPVGRQVYRLLTSIHDSFEQITEKILATDRAKREAAEQEKKLAAISSPSFDIHKLEVDLHSIKKENEFLEQKLWHN